MTMTEVLLYSNSCSSSNCGHHPVQVLAEQPFKKWMPLVDSEFRFGPEPLGEILLGAEFIYSKKGRKFLSLPFRLGRPKNVKVKAGASVVSESPAHNPRASNRRKSGSLSSSVMPSWIAWNKRKGPTSCCPPPSRCTGMSERPGRRSSRRRCALIAHADTAESRIS
jgi:hypothetical protein